MIRMVVALLAVVLSCAVARAENLVIQMNLLEPGGIGAGIGTVTVSETDYGLAFAPHLEGLSPGLHGFHVHQNASCAPAEKDGKMVPGLAAGGHYDPNHTGLHDTPFGSGHLGDLPALFVDSSGKADHPVLAPRIKKIEEIRGRTLMIHAGGDNYADAPAKLGGGGARMACGLIE